MKRIKTVNNDSISPIHFMAGGMTVKFATLALTNTNFRMDDHNNDTIQLKVMDFKHLNISDFNLIAENGQTILNVTQGNYATVAEGERRYNESYNNGEGWNPILILIKKVAEEN